jgi:hypothetical protein
VLYEVVHVVFSCGVRLNGSCHRQRQLGNACLNPTQKTQRLFGYEYYDNDDTMTNIQ